MGRIRRRAVAAKGKAAKISRDRSSEQRMAPKPEIERPGSGVVISHRERGM